MTQSNIANDQQLFVDCESLVCGYVSDSVVNDIVSERFHAITTPTLNETGDVTELAAAQHVTGVIFSLGIGVVPWPILKVMARLLFKRLPVWLSWGGEGRVMRVGIRQWPVLFAQRLAWMFYSRWYWREAEQTLEGMLDETAVQALEVSAAFDQVFPHLQLQAFANLPDNPGSDDKVSGTGIYFRGDFWAPLVAGGSYGHTVYVAKELAAATEDFVCLMANPIDMIDTLGIRQEKLSPPGEHGNDLNVLKGTAHYYEQIKAHINSLEKPPAYIYERLVLGNYAAARISRDMGIPYICEYNGSEISMKRSFDTQGYDYEDVFMLSEEAAFNQAALIVVVSEAVKETVVRRGIDPNKIIVNPNGVDRDHYKPAPAAEKAAIKKEFGWHEDQMVIGFIGTFGGWHGIDVLGESIPQIAERHPDARFLLIGDGGYRHLVEDAVKAHGLEDKVKLTGMVPQAEGGRLLRACDIYVSPHSAHMVDSRFFGSPTKLFEYMAMGGAVIASDLEQIGDVMRPSLFPEDIATVQDVGDARGVLVTPGDVPDFVNAVCGLLDRPELIKALGRNAAEAVGSHFSWQRHVERIWQHAVHLYGSVKRYPGQAAAPKAVVDRPMPGPIDGLDARALRSREQDASWYVEQRKARYEKKYPWLEKAFKLRKLRDKKVLIIAPENGYDAVTLAQHGAQVTLVDDNSVNLHMAEIQFRLLGLEGNFIPVADVTDLPFIDDSYDVAICVNRLSLLADPEAAINEIGRVLVPGGRILAGLVSVWSLKYWYRLFFKNGIRKGRLLSSSMGQVMARNVDMTYGEKRGMVMAYNSARAKGLAADFKSVKTARYGMDSADIPNKIQGKLPAFLFSWFLGDTLVLTARKPGKGFPIYGITGRNHPMPQYDFDEQLEEIGMKRPEWVNTRREKAFTPSGAAISNIEALKQACPQQVEKTVAAADKILAHEFDLLGSGPTVWNNPDSPTRAGYKPIHWHWDPVRDLVFPGTVPHKHWNLFAMRPGNADVKYPWELGRLQHWPVLAQAWLLSGDSKYLAEIAAQLRDFMACNPVGVGVNWTCTMDVAIRAANMALTFDLIRDANLTRDKAFFDDAWYALFVHGDFIYRNLENHYEVTSNHFLSNVGGLAFVAEAFKDLPAGKEWQAFCLKAWEQEIIVQILPDGADYESSVPYHRLVSELFMAGWQVSRFGGHELSSAYAAVLEKMIDFMHALTRPDGRMPQIGDADDGRLHIFTDYGSWDRQDARHLFAPASLMLGLDGKWMDRLPALEGAKWECFWWGLDWQQVAAKPANAVFEAFPDAGLYVHHQDSQYFLANNAIVGTKGFGNHKHNDLLSFEWHLDGTPMIVDPGSHVYTSDFDSRNLFRSTSYHATVGIDGLEQNDMRPDWIFRMFAEATPFVAEHKLDDGRMLWTGCHDGYRRAGGPLHWRSFVHDGKTGAVVVLDRLCGGDYTTASWSFPLAPGAKAFEQQPGCWRLSNGDQAADLVVKQALAIRSVDGGYSPSYGVQQPSTILRFDMPQENGDLEIRLIPAGMSVTDMDHLSAVAKDRMQALAHDGELEGEPA